MDALMGATTTVAHTAEIEGLRAEINRLRSALVAERNKAVDAMKVISTTFAEKADEYGLCDTYDEVVESVNEALPEGFPKIDPRRRTFTVKATYSIVVERDVEATTEEQALEEFREEVETELNGMERSGDIDGYTFEDSEIEVES